MGNGGLVVFDIDGTLFMAERVSYMAYQLACGEYGTTPPDVATVRRFFGEKFEGVARILGLPWGEDWVRRFFARVEELERENVEKYGGLYDGVQELLMGLRAGGYKLALCSMGEKTYVESVMRHHLQGIPMDSVRHDEPGKDKAVLLREILEESSPDFSVMVGDRSFDAAAAQQCGIPFIACMYGYSPTELADQPVQVHTPGEILDAVEKLRENSRGEIS